MTDSEKTFLATHEGRNREIFDAMVARHGEYRAKITSNMANLSVIVTGLAPCTCMPTIAEDTARICARIHADICTHEGWDVKEVADDIEVFRKARMLQL